MSKLDRGVFVFNEWFESARNLSGLEFKKLFMAMYYYQVHGQTPPTFTQKGESIASIIFPCLEKRINGLSYSKRSTSDSACENEPSDTSKGILGSEGDPTGDPIGVKSATPWTIEKKSKEKNSISPPLSSSRRTRSGRCRATESEEEKKHWDEFFQAAVKRALGEYERESDEQ